MNELVGRIQARKDTSIKSVTTVTSIAHADCGYVVFLVARYTKVPAISCFRNALSSLMRVATPNHFDEMKKRRKQIHSLSIVIEYDLTEEEVSDIPFPNDSTHFVHCRRETNRQEAASKRVTDLPSSAGSNRFSATPVAATRSSTTEAAATGVVCCLASSIASVSTTLAGVLNNWLLATDLGVAHLLAVRTLDTRVVPGKRTFSALMAFSITIAADDLSRVGAILLAMSFLTTIMASTAAAALRAVTREVTNCSR